MNDVLENVRARMHDLWEQLRRNAPGVSHWHLVVHHDLLELPFKGLEGLNPAHEHERIHLYPGVAMFGRLRQREQNQQKPEKRAARGAAVLHHDAALSHQPIPFVQVDAKAMAQVFGGGEVYAGGSVRERLQEGQEPPWLLASASHGGTRSKQVVVQLDRAQGIELGAQQILGLGVGASVIYQGNCLAARVNEAFGEEPLGLVPAFMARGAHAVVGSLMPVPDVWMPLFGALWAHAMQHGGADAHEALRQAKRQFAKPVERPEEVTRLLRPLYSEVMTQVMASVMSPDTGGPESGEGKVGLLRGVRGWPMSNDRGEQYFEVPGDRSETEAQWLAREQRQNRQFVQAMHEPEARERLIEDCLTGLLEQRPSQSQIEQMQVWMTSFGG